MLDIYVDADACPVKDEIYKVAERFELNVFVVANRHVELPMVMRLRAIRVPGGPDAADDWIAEHATIDDVVITEDLPLAGRAIERGAHVLTSRGRSLTPENIGDALATRDLMQSLRDEGMMTGGPAGFSKADRSTFLQRLDDLIRQIRRRQSA